MYSVADEGVTRLNVDPFPPNEEIARFILKATADEAIPTEAPLPTMTAQQRAAQQRRLFG
jgi:hypothetical protein